MATDLTDDLRTQFNRSPRAARLRGTYRRDRVTIRCEGCGHRIAWWTAELRFGLGWQDGSHRGWKWQGLDSPVRLRGPLIDVECQSCGWAKDAAARQPNADWWSAPPEVA